MLYKKLRNTRDEISQRLGALTADGNFVWMSFVLLEDTVFNDVLDWVCTSARHRTRQFGWPVGISLKACGPNLQY